MLHAALKSTPDALKAAPAANHWNQQAGDGVVGIYQLENISKVFIYDIEDTNNHEDQNIKHCSALLCI